MYRPLLLALVLAGCGGADLSAPPPEPQFVDPSGTFDIAGDFTANPPTTFTGTLVLDRGTTPGTLTGFMAVRATNITGSVSGTLPITGGVVLADSTVAFHLDGVSGAQWDFQAYYESGVLFGGTHRLHHADTLYVGTWGGSRQ